MPQESLTGWLERPHARHGVHFGRADGGWSHASYESLAERVRATSRGLAARGVRPGDVVSIVAGTGPDFVATFFAAVALGATPSPLPPPRAFDDPAEHLARLARLTAVAPPRLVAVEPGLLQAIDEHDARGSAAAFPPRVAIETLPEPGGDPPWDASRSRRPLLQFTSGSSGAARGVWISRGALEANVSAIRRWLRWSADDPFASWLPLHHDMGLIGAFLCSTVSQSDLWLLPPEAFVRDPLRYVRCMGEKGVRLSVMPGFGLGHVLRRVRPAELDGLDLSGVRGIVVGAERLDAATLEGFARLLAPVGFSRGALLPAYGLAEATLAVTGVPVGEAWGSAAVDAASLTVGRRVGPATAGPDDPPVVGCGRPLEGVEVRIVDEALQPLPEGHVGEIVVKGASLADGYAGDADDALGTPGDAGLRTGDAGFLLGGQLHVLGRLGDGLKVRGRAIFSEDLEVALARRGVPQHRTAVLLGTHEGRATAVLVTEEEAPPWRAAAEALLRQRTEGARVVFVAVPRGGLARTSSGKPRRRHLWSRFAEGSLTPPPTRAPEPSPEGGATAAHV